MSANSKLAALEARSCTQLFMQDISKIVATNRGMMLKIIMKDGSHWYTHEEMSVHSIPNTASVILEGRFTK